MAELAAAGATNREAARALFLAEKTVQYHLTRIYGKLGIRSRSELAARFRLTDREHESPAIGRRPIVIGNREGWEQD